MKRRNVLSVAVALAAAAIFGGCGKKEEAPATKAADAPRPIESATVKIGTASPLTGPQAHIGIDIRNGVQLGVEDANAAGVEIGGRKEKVGVVLEDGETNPPNPPTAPPTHPP